jgi:hypothetical protein
MSRAIERPATRDRNAQLTDALRNVRNRWRFAVALRGLVVVLGVGLLVFVTVALVMDALRYAPSAVMAARVLLWTAIIGLAVRFLAMPLWRKIPDDRVALYLEEREPSLDAAVVTAVQLGQSTPATPSPSHSSALGKRLVDTAVERVHRLDDGKRIERPRITREGAILAGLVAAGVASLVFGPASLRHGFRLLVPWRTAEAASPYRLAVRPGNVTLPRGGDVKIETRLYGFQSERVELVVKPADSTSWTRTAMTTEGDSSGAYVTRLFDVTQRTEYYVETGGVRSPTYRIDVTDLPYSKRIDLEYRYPAYTGRQPETIENGGDIAALRGTLVTVRVTPTRPARSGRLVVEGGAPVALTADSTGVLAGVLRVDKPGFYKVELEGPSGRMLPASLDYTIDVLDDRPPSVRVSKPGRDTKATAVEEVFVEAVAEDDFGVSSLELLYSVNGGPEQRRALAGSGGRGSRETSGSHTFLLEELKLEPGDVIAYYARATDNNRVGTPQTASTDIYFLEIRPFAQEYRQQQAGGGGGGGGEDPGKLSMQQRQIVAGTFKTERDRKTIPAKQFQEDVTTLGLAQSRVREQADQLARRLVERGIAAQDSNYAKIAEILPKAVAEMRTAEATLGRRDTKGALAPEQRALQHLQRAEAVFREIMVNMGGEGGGGGGGEQQEAEDLADLFELERDKMRNQYEAVQRGRQEQQQQADNQVDEALERLKQLAARQQQENERLRRKADSLRAQQSNTQGGGGGGQRQLADQAEETARQLERLAREQSNPQLAESARRLQEAADAMRRSASTDGARSLADANAALDRLKDARRLLDREREGRASRDATDAAKTARELAEAQRRIADAQRQLGEQPGAESGERGRALSERKGELADRVRDFKGQLDRSALDTRRDQPETARQMQEAANSLRDRKTEEKIRYSRGLIGAGDPEQARSLEGQISAELDSTARALERAAASAGSGDGRREGEALDRARDLVRGLSSLDERMRDREGGERRAPGEQQESNQRPREQQQRGQQQSGQQPGQQPAGQQPGGQQPGGQQQSGQPQAGQPQDGPRQANQAQGGGRPNATQAGPPRRGGGSPGMSTEEIRQYQRELRERIAEAEALRRELRAQGQDVGQLDRLLGQLRGLNGAMGGGADAGEVAGLRASVVEGFKAYEFALRRELEGGDKERLLLGRQGDVPAGFKQMVEDYYKSLAGQKPRR